MGDSPLKEHVVGEIDAVGDENAGAFDLAGRFPELELGHVLASSVSARLINGAD
jgi:hypothetical protein